MTEYDPSYYQENKTRYNHYAARARDKLKEETIAAYGGKCVLCGESDPVVLVIDHINDDGKIERELYGISARGGHKHYARLKKAGWPKDRFQLLCHNCNARKEYNRRREALYAHVGEPVDLNRAVALAKAKAQSNNKIGIKGVFWDTQKHKWTARIMIQGKTNSLGFFSSVREAAYAYGRKAREVWGETAYIATEEDIVKAEEYIAAPAVAHFNPEDLGL